MRSVSNFELVSKLDAFSFFFLSVRLANRDLFEDVLRYPIFKHTINNFKPS